MNCCCSSAILNATSCGSGRSTSGTANCRFIARRRKSRSPFRSCRRSRPRSTPCRKGDRHLTFLVTGQGRPFTAESFGQWFTNRCDEDGLPRKDSETGKPRCTRHGLRKTAAIRFADRGATVPELMSWFGWRSPSEAIRYVEAADRGRVAKAAAKKLRTDVDSDVSNQKPGLTK
jgi:integrase